MILTIGPGHPFHLRTWSGISYWLLNALKEQGVLEGSVDARPPGVDVLERIGSWNIHRERWRQRYWAHASPLSGAVRALLGVTAARRARTMNSSPDVVLQLGAGFDARSGLRPRLRCSYSDMHLALFLTRPDNLLDTSTPLVRKALDRERRTFDSLDVIFTMSDWLRDSIITDAGQDPGKVVTIGTGANINIPPSPPKRNLAPPRFLFVGMRFERKGGRYLLDAFDLVRSERPDAELWIVGPEKSLGQREGVRWFGRIDRSSPAGEAEIRRLYTEATAFVMPSVFEPAGMVFLEAMAYALPCVGSNCCAMPEFIAHGETGLLARRADSEDLAAQLLALASAPERAQEMGWEGYRRLTGRFTWEHVARRMVTEMEGRLRTAI
jgi:glycosyltransferase involved in cell wall biosynthesis